MIGTAALRLPVPRPLLRFGWLRLVGPAFAVSIGYVDPGNWASDLAAGKFGYALLWVVLAANAVAIILQLAVTRVTIALNLDLATAIARRWPRLSPPLWCAFQGSAIATDLAEFTGIVLGSQLLFHIGIAQSIAIGLGAVAVLFALDRRSARTLGSAMILVVIGLAAIFGAVVFALRPDLGEALRGATIPSIPSGEALLVVVAIVGATVMPHNLFLHSALVHERCVGVPNEVRRARGRFFARETLVALNVAAVINAAILIVGACLRGHTESIETAFAALGPSAGIGIATLFGAGLLASGVAATTTATLSGDYICAAFSPIRISAPLRRTATILPAAALLLVRVDPTSLLLWSQTALCLLLPIALIPLLGLLRGTQESARSFNLTAAAAGICIVLDVALLAQTLGGTNG
jgi:manganese transport protein